VGQAFAIAAVDQCVEIPDAPALNPTNGLSVEAWVLLSSYPTLSILGVAAVHKDVLGVEPKQYSVNVYQTGSGSVFQLQLGVVPQGLVELYGATLLQTNTWYHVAMTYDTAELRLYVNGALENSMPVTAPIARTTGPLRFGGYGGVDPHTLQGLIDEVSLYDRALSSGDVQAIYAAGSSGKCFGPRITVQPQGQVGYWGGNVTFTVHAVGSEPLTYLWSKDGFPIVWATNSTLVLTNLALDAGGEYSVFITGPVDSVTSSNALLTVNPAGVSLGLYPGLTIQGTPGRNFGIQYTTNVSPGATWLTLTQFTLMQPIQLWIDLENNAASGANPRRFYRVVAVP
jgi:hypothetical protein